jgi:hypothetical protein
VSLSLITDRAVSDVTALETLRTKIKNRTASTAEWIQWLSDSKGAYNSSDLNRVGEAISYIAGLLNGYGYAVTVNPKTDWAVSDIPSGTQMNSYFNDLSSIKNVFYGTTELPASMNHIDHEDANNIEILMLEIETYINRMVAGFRKCGTFKSGQGVILP